jgi:hypothetical protein
MEQQRPERRPAHRAETDPEIQILIESGIEVARRGRRDIDPATARMIAHALATAPDGPMARFAKTNQISNDEARAEYLPIYLDETTPDDIRELIDWLGVYLIHTENPRPLRADHFGSAPSLSAVLWQITRTLDGIPVDLYVRGDLSPDDEPEVLERLTGLIRTYGDPFLHFLEMHDVDGAADNAEQSFHDFFVGSFTSKEEALKGLIEIDEIEEAISALATRYTGAEYVSLDREALWERVCDVWDVIESGEQYHVFNK